MKKIPFTATLVVVAVVGLGLGAGIGAWQRGQNTPQAPTAAAAGLNTGAGATGAAAAGGANASARPTFGTVQKVSGKELTLQAQGGATTRVTLADSTAITRVDTGALADLTAGTAVLVVGQQQGDTVTANSVEIGGTGATLAAGQFGQAGQNGQAGQRAQQGQGGQAGAAGGQAAGTIARLTGKVDSIAADGFTLATDAGKTKIVVPANARIQKVAQATAADLKEGASVQVTGDTGADGAVAAKSLLIMPAGQGAGQGRTGN